MPLRLVWTLALVALAAPALAQPTALVAPAGRGALYARLGYFRASGFYNDTPWSFGLQPSVLSLTLGGEVRALHRRTFDGTVGAALRLADYRAHLGPDEDEPVFESGFRPQGLDLYARLFSADVAATAGFLLDLGPNFFDIDEDDPFNEAGGHRPFLNSDAQHAIRLGVATKRPFGAVRLSAALDGFLTLPGRFEALNSGPEPGEDLVIVRGTRDVGDTAVLRVGAACPLGAAEVGLDVVYATTTGGRSELDEPLPALPGLPEPPAVSREPGRSLLSLVPHVTFAPAGSAFEIEVAGEAPGGSYGEHTPHGVTLTGEHQPRVRLPLSLSVRYGF